MNTLSRFNLMCLFLFSITASAVPATAESTADKVVALTKPALAVGVTACLFSSDTDGLDRAARASEAVILSVGIARTVKRTTHSGFPSGHTASAFAMASSLSEVHPKQKWLYYGAATVIAYSIVASNDHTVVEALGGAVLGTTIGQMSMTSRDGLFLSKTFKF